MKITQGEDIFQEVFMKVGFLKETCNFFNINAFRCNNSFRSQPSLRTKEPLKLFFKDAFSDQETDLI